MKKVLENIKNILMILVIVMVIIPIIFISIIILLDSYQNPNEVPSFFGWKPFIVLSNSMDPTIRSGDLIVVKEVYQDKITVGDIISYLDNNLIITHRVISVEEYDGEEYYLTKGDRNVEQDETLVNFNMVEGIYQYKISGLGDLLMFMQSTNGMIICLSIPCILLFIIQLRSNDNSKKDTSK